jgi:hypothetical protein
MSDQLALALDDRHAGQDANLAAGTKPHRDDRKRVEVALGALARSGATFTADDVHKRIQKDSPELYDANIVSSAMGIWAKDGRIVEVYGPPVTSSRRSRHASRNRRWCGAQHSRQEEVE